MNELNYSTIQNALTILRRALLLYVAERYRAKYADAWWEQGMLPHLQRMEQVRGRLAEAADEDARLALLDTAALLTLVEKQFSELFLRDLGREGQGYIQELIAVRNHWAHEETFTRRQVERALDTLVLLLGRMRVPAEFEAVNLQASYLTKAGIHASRFNAETRRIVSIIVAFLLLAAAGLGIRQLVLERETGNTGGRIGLAAPATTASTSGAPAICTCRMPDLDCPVFATRPEAQACLEKCAAEGVGDIYNLDSNRDGSACTSLP